MSADQLVKNPETGKVVIAQPPNLPLWIFIVAAVAHRIFHAAWLGVVATVALAIWAVMEVVSGDSPFRRILGGVVLVVIAAGLLLR